MNRAPQRQRGRPRKYDWKKLLGNRDGEWVELVKGRDFHCLTDGFKQQIRSQALREGVQVSIRTVDDYTIAVRVVPNL